MTREDKRSRRGICCLTKGILLELSSTTRTVHMSLAELKKKCGCDWTAIERARLETEKQVTTLRDLVGKVGSPQAPLDSEDISIVVFGSLARCEWTSSSDLD